MDLELLKDMARHQAWADAEHWKVLHSDSKLLEDAQIRKRLNHMLNAYEMLQTLARGEVPDYGLMKDRESVEEIEASMRKAGDSLIATLESAAPADLEKMIKMPRGPKGPFDAPAGVLLLQALLHSQHHRGQNAARMREMGVSPPMTDFVIWYALGQP